MTTKPEPRLIIVLRIAGVLLFLFGGFAPGLFLPSRFNGAPAFTIPQLAFSYVCRAAVFLGILLLVATIPAIYRARITFRDWCWIVFAFALISCWWADHQMQQRKLDAANRSEYLRAQQSESELTK
jgi:hypothetical protein